MPKQSNQTNSNTNTNTNTNTNSNNNNNNNNNRFNNDNKDKHIKRDSSMKESSSNDKDKRIDRDNYKEREVKNTISQPPPLPLKQSGINQNNFQDRRRNDDRDMKGNHGRSPDNRRERDYDFQDSKNKRHKH